MAGLGVLLEVQNQHHVRKECPQILVKSSMLRPRLPSSPSKPLRSTPSTTFLDSCYLCNKHLSHEKDIYMYRGDRAFCSVECRRKQINMDEDSARKEKRTFAASTTCASRHQTGQAAARGGFVY